MPKLTEYEKSIKNVGKMNSDRAKKKWGIAWDRLGRDMQENAVAMECLMGVFSAIDPNVDVQVARDVFKATLEAAGLLE